MISNRRAIAVPMVIAASGGFVVAGIKRLTHHKPLPTIDDEIRWPLRAHTRRMPRPARGVSWDHRAARLN